MNRLLSISLTAALLAGITACGEQNDNTPIPIIDAIAFGDVEAVNQHLADNIDVNAPDELGRTLFHHAIAKGDTDIITAMINAGADINQPDEQGMTPLATVIAAGLHDATDLLLKQDGINLEAPNSGGPSPLTEALVRNDLGLVERLLKQGADINGPGPHGRTALHMAAMFQRSEQMEWLLDRNANLTQTCNRGQLPLHAFMWTAHDFGDEEYKNDVMTLAILLDHTPDINAQDNHGMTPMHFGIMYARPLIVRKLCEAGADLSIQSQLGYTPMSYLFGTEFTQRNAQANRAIVKIMREFGITDDTIIASSSGTTMRP